MIINNHSGHIVQLNIQSLTYEKAVWINKYNDKHKPFVIVLNETKRKSSAILPRFPNYISYHIPGTDNNNAGGILVLVRNDIVGSEQFNIIPGYQINNQMINMDNDNPIKSTQWAALRLSINGYDKDIILIPYYIHPTAHSLITSEFINQLKMINQWINNRYPNNNNNNHNEPHVLLIGDSNLHCYDIGSSNHIPCHGALYDSIIDEGYECSNVQHSFGIPTHNRNGILDLCFERLHSSGQSIIQSIDIDNTADNDIGATGSDHYPLIIQLNILYPSLPSFHKSLIWNTDKANDDQINQFKSSIELVFQGNLSNGNSRNDILSNTIADALHQLDSFCIGSNDVTINNYRIMAQQIVDRVWDECYHPALLEIATSIIGRRKKNPGNKKEFTQEVKNKHRRALQAERSYRRDPLNNDLKHEAIIRRKEFQRSFYQMRKQSWNEIIHSIQTTSDRGAIDIGWRALKKVKNSKEGFFPISAGIRRYDGSLTTSVKESLDHFADHYEKTVFVPHNDFKSNNSNIVNPTVEDIKKNQDKLLMEEELSKHPPINRTLMNMPSSSLLVTDNNIFIKLLSKTSIKTSSGPDELNGQLLRWCSESLSFIESMILLINFCYVFHILPQSWRRANLAPLLKKNGKLNECNSYRPISITDIIMRQIERLIKYRIADRLDYHLSPWQAGFRKNRSTRQQILFIHHRITEAIRLRPSYWNKQIDPYPVIFLDIKRAFDSVPLDALLIKLYRAGIRGNELNYFRSFLSDRQFRIVAQDQVSDWRPINAGVPQGAVNSPLLYALFINDSINATNNKHDISINRSTTSITRSFITEVGSLYYADDIAIAPPINYNLDQRKIALQNYLTDLGDWAHRWGVRFSDTKSGCVWFHSPDFKMKHLNNIDYKINFSVNYTSQYSISIPNTDRYQYLGVWFDETLSSKPHFAHMRSKCLTASNMIRGIINNDGPPDFSVIRRLVLSIILPRCTYGLPFIHLTKNQANKLDSLLYRPLLSILSISSTVHRYGFAVRVGIPPMIIQRQKELILFITSILKQINDKHVRDNPSLYPTFHLVWSNCTKESVMEWAKSYYSLKSENSRSTERAFSRHSIIRSFKMRTVFWSFHHMRSINHPHIGDSVINVLPTNIFSLLPSQSIIDNHNDDSGPRSSSFSSSSSLSSSVSITLWNPVPYKSFIITVSDIVSRYMWLLSTRGIHYSYRGGNTLHHFSQSVHRYDGVNLPPLYGVTDPPLGYINISMTDYMFGAACFITPYATDPSLFIDTRYHAKIRNRIILNREFRFNAVKYQHSILPNADQFKKCNYIHCIPRNLDQTAEHALVYCNKYREQRNILRQKLKSIINRIWEYRCEKRGRYISLLPTYYNVLYHVIIASPVVLSIINDHRSRRRLLRLTGGFIEYIHSLQPD